MLNNNNAKGGFFLYPILFLLSVSGTLTLNRNNVGGIKDALYFVGALIRKGQKVEVLV